MTPQTTIECLSALFYVQMNGHNTPGIEEALKELESIRLTQIKNED